VEINIYDHIVAAIFVVILPLVGVWEHRRLEARVGAGIPNARMQGYKLIMVMEWGLAIVIIARWLAAGRSLSDLGIGFASGLGWWIGCGLTLAAGILFILQAVTILRSPERIEEARRQIEPLKALLPHTESEARAFAGLAVTAGLCEELMYRGFLLAYLSSVTNLWLAVILSSIAFGLGHLYQGKAGIAKTAVIGLIMAGLCLLTRSLWAPMLLHALIDLTSGFMGRRVIELSDGSAAPDAD
jgi:membrane protease YdiL (CAAX protease family)